MLVRAAINIGKVIQVKIKPSAIYPPCCRIEKLCISILSSESSVSSVRSSILPLNVHPFVSQSLNKLIIPRTMVCKGKKPFLFVVRRYVIHFSCFCIANIMFSCCNIAESISFCPSKISSGAYLLAINNYFPPVPYKNKERAE